MIVEADDTPISASDMARRSNAEVLLVGTYFDGE